jgi:TolB-like protein/DNA-binding winged helix-turn-helix (wHTH) protein/Tfp pilus assembly protein PilF
MTLDTGESTKLKFGFQLGKWAVKPMLGEISAGQESVRLQPKSMDVLLHLAENAGVVVERDALLRHVWGERAQSDEPLTRCIGELRRALGDTRGQPEYIQTIPKRGYQLLKPVAPDPAGDESDGAAGPADPQHQSRPGRSGKIVIAAVILLGLVFAGTYLERQRTDSGDYPADISPERSIVVLPFLNLSSDKEQEYFSDGISEELLNRLTRIPEIRVISRTSAFSYKGKDIDIRSIAAQLNVAHVLEGSVRKSGKQVRITAQLIDARADTPLWSETYERTLDDIFATQDEIAAMVVEKLKIAFHDNTPPAHSIDPEAYALVLQAEFLGQQGTSAGIEQSFALYEQALEIDPDYSAAWSGLSRNYRSQAGHAPGTDEEATRLARDAAKRALALDPGNADAHAGLASIARGSENDLEAAARHYGRALALAPGDTDILRHAAVLLRSLDRLDQAIAVFQYVVRHDPVNPVGHYNLGITYLFAGRLDEALASFHSAQTLSPEMIGVRNGIGMALLLKGEPSAALEAFRKEGDEEYRVKGAAMSAYAMGRQAEFEAEFGELRERWGRHWPSEVAQVYAWTGNADAAFEWLDKAVAKTEDGLNQQFLVPFYAPLHAEPRWAAFRGRTGNSAAELAAIEFEVTLPE